MLAKPLSAKVFCGGKKMLDIFDISRLKKLITFHNFFIQILVYISLRYRPFHKTLPRSNAYLKWMSVRFYETDCISQIKMFNLNLKKSYTTWISNLLYELKRHIRLSSDKNFDNRDFSMNFNKIFEKQFWIFACPLRDCHVTWDQTHLSSLGQFDALLFHARNMPWFK